jgi:hypothetical protein
MKEKRNISSIRLIASILLTLSLYAVFETLPALAACSDHRAQSLVLALCAGMGFHLLAGGRSRRLLAGAVIVVLLACWLGFYPISPLFKNTLQGFTVITQRRGSLRIAPGAVISLAAGQPTALEPLTATSNLRCNWMSTQGGAFDDPGSCATVYIPPHSESDVLKISIQPACGLPRVVGQIKISILP